MSEDNAIHPKHYDGTACLGFAKHMEFNVGNAFKYAWRLGRKDTRANELGKIIQYLVWHYGELAEHSKPYFIVRAMMHECNLVTLPHVSSLPNGNDLCLYICKIHQHSADRVSARTATDSAIKLAQIMLDEING